LTSSTTDIAANRIDRRTGEFCDPATETSFQTRVWPARYTHLKFISYIIAGIVFLFVIPEYVRFGDEPVFAWLLGSRTLMAVLIIVSGVSLRWFHRLSDEFSFMPQMAIPPMLTFLDYLKGGEPLYYGNMLLVILVLYIFVPNRMIYSVTAGVSAALLSGFSLAILHQTPVPQIVTMVGMLVVANILGFLALRHFNFARRQEYLSYMTERSGREQLRAEIEKRLATEDGLRLALSVADQDSQAITGTLNNLSHELRTPLNAIIGFSDSMQKELFGPLANDQYREYSTIIHDSGNHLLELINNMLDHSKAESGTVQLDETIVDVEKLVNSVLPMVGSLAREAGVTVTATSLSPVPCVRVDEQKVRQILLNLMSNAIKFTPTDGKVELIVGVPEDRTVVLAVKDSGVGIPEEDIDRIFRPFEQSMAHGMRGEAGTGLGLPLSRQLAELHGARISVESRVNEGSVFALVLPPERYVSGETEEQ
jgi:signal transduction histidine kinase